MNATYVKRQSPAQKKDVSTASSVLDSSSQNESLQCKADMVNNATQRAEAPRPNNTGMPDNLKAGIESLSGFSMDDVRVHYNSSKPATVQALAYTQGTDIHVAPGQEKHLPHEAWHVAQQMAGRVSPTTNINGMPVNDNISLEHEADIMGEKAKQNTEKNSEFGPHAQLKANTIQRVLYAEAEDKTTTEINILGTLYKATIDPNIKSIYFNDEYDHNEKANFIKYLKYFFRNKQYHNINIKDCNNLNDILKKFGKISRMKKRLVGEAGLDADLYSAGIKEISEYYADGKSVSDILHDSAVSYQDSFSHITGGLCGGYSLYNLINPNEARESWAKIRKMWIDNEYNSLGNLNQARELAAFVEKVREMHEEVDAADQGISRNPFYNSFNVDKILIGHNNESLISQLIKIVVIMNNGEGMMLSTGTHFMSIVKNGKDNFSFCDSDLFGIHVCSLGDLEKNLLNQYYKVTDKNNRHYGKFVISYKRISPQALNKKRDEWYSGSYIR